MLLVKKEKVVCVEQERGSGERWAVSRLTELSSPRGTSSAAQHSSPELFHAARLLKRFRRCFLRVFSCVCAVCMAYM